jgi:hypothetical protein
MGFTRIHPLGGAGGSNVSGTNDLTDMNTENSAHGEILVYNSTIGAWENVSRSVEGNANIGYFGLLTDFYNGGSTTDTVIQSNDVNEWVDVNFVTTTNNGLFDYRPETMVNAVADPYDDATGLFSLEGLTIRSFGTFRASFTYLPLVDEGEIDVRLCFQRHSGTTPDTDFYIEQNTMIMNKGTNIEYPAEPTLTFFIGDTIDTNGVGDAGKCKFQIRSNVAGTVKMRALTWYLTE